MLFSPLQLYNNYKIKKYHVRASVVAQWIKPPFVTQTMHCRASIQVLDVPLQIQLCANIPEKAAADGPSTLTSAAYIGDLDGVSGLLTSAWFRTEYCSPLRRDPKDGKDLYLCHYHSLPASFFLPAPLFLIHFFLLLCL